MWRQPDQSSFCQLNWRPISPLYYERMPIGIQSFLLTANQSSVFPVTASNPKLVLDQNPFVQMFWRRWRKSLFNRPTHPSLVASSIRPLAEYAIQCAKTQFMCEFICQLEYREYRHISIIVLPLTGKPLQITQNNAFHSFNGSNQNYIYQLFATIIVIVPELPCCLYKYSISCCNNCMSTVEIHLNSNSACTF